MLRLKCSNTSRNTSEAGKVQWCSAPWWKMVQDADLWQKSVRWRGWGDYRGPWTLDRSPYILLYSYKQITVFQNVWKHDGVKFYNLKILWREKIITNHIICCFFAWSLGEVLEEEIRAMEGGWAHSTGQADRQNLILLTLPYHSVPYQTIP